MQKKTNRKNIISTLIIAAVIIVAIGILFLISNFKHVEEEVSPYKQIESAIINATKYKSYELKKSEVVLKMIKTEDAFSDFAYQIDTVLTKKDDKVRVDSYYLAGDEKEYFGGIFVSPKYTEFMYSDIDSIFFESKDIFKVIKTYVPTLSEVCDDFEKIKFNKIKNVISKSLKKYIKSNGKEIFEEYSKFLEENLDDYMEFKNVEASGSDTYILLKMNIKDFVKFESDILIKAKNDKLIKDMISSVGADLIKYFEDSKEYEKIRMNEEEFNAIKFNYEEELSNFYTNEMTKRIDYIQALYSGVVDGNDDKYIELVFKLDEEGKIKAVTTEGVTFLDDAVVSNLVNYSISKENEIKNSDINPVFPSRTNLVSQNRNELYYIFESVKAKYDEKGLNFFSNLLGLDKIKEES